MGSKICGDGDGSGLVKGAVIVFIPRENIITIIIKLILVRIEIYEGSEVASGVRPDGETFNRVMTRSDSLLFQDLSDRSITIGIATLSDGQIPVTLYVEMGIICPYHPSLNELMIFAVEKDQQQWDDT